ncbi:MAG TPA: PAS domain-containing protein [Kofleriaceae bacterium]|nr:PAS domain-containing protein [Kofleriaceae bacterium]
MTRPESNATHPLLVRQLARLGLAEDRPPATADEWSRLLARVSASYTEADQARYTLERSLEVSSCEMQRHYQELVRSSRSELSLQRDMLEKSVATLHATLEASLDGVLVVDQRGLVVDFNQRFLDIWGLPEENIRGADQALLIRHASALMVDGAEFERRVLALDVSPGSSSHEELALRDGRFLERFSAPVVLPTGPALGRVWFFRDVTARRRAEDEVRQASGLLDAVFENIPDLVCVKDAETLRFVRLNRAAEELVGLDRSVAIGKGDRDFFTAEAAAFFESTDRRVLREGGLVDIAENPVDTLHRGRRLLHTKKIPIAAEDGRPKYLLGISRDITEEKRAERELRDAKEAAEKARHTTSGFLSNMSLEMRRPLNSILGFARVLDGQRFGELRESQREYVQYILRAGQRMLNLVNDLLDLRRLADDREPLASTRLALDPLVDEAIQSVKAVADEKGHVVEVDLPPRLPAARADRRAVVQILVNLLSNALKFTAAPGRIRVRAAADAAELRIAVEDSGVGIRSEDQPVLFTYFEELGPREDHSMKGSGVGLALTRALVEKLGGAIRVTSTVGVGSTFEFSVPRWTEPAGP